MSDVNYVVSAEMYWKAVNDLNKLEADNAVLREQVKAQSDSLLGQYRIVAEMQDRAITVERERDALRLKVQGLDRTLADVYAQRDGLQRDLTTLETLVKRLPVVQPHNMTAYMRDFLNFYDREDYDALAALLTHRQGMK